MNSVFINGRSFRGAHTVVIRNGVVTVDGVRQDGTVNGVVEIRVEGVLNHLECDAAVNCGEVRGNVTAGGSVNCDSIGGSLNAGGSVNCDKAGGAINAGGSVRIG